MGSIDTEPWQHTRHYCRKCSLIQLSMLHMMPSLMTLWMLWTLKLLVIYIRHPYPYCAHSTVTVPAPQDKNQFCRTVWNGFRFIEHQVGKVRTQYFDLKPPYKMYVRRELGQIGKKQGFPALLSNQLLFFNC